MRWLIPEAALLAAAFLLWPQAVLPIIAAVGVAAIFLVALVRANGPPA